MKHSFRRMMGFTLVEISVILLALGLILPSAALYWQFLQQQQVSTGQMDAQQQTRDALVGFLHANYRLPCPAVDALGIESCIQGAGLHQVGFVPWRTLGLPRPEAGQLRYGVYREYSATAHTDRDLASLRDRMNPLRVTNPSPEPENNDAPNPILKTFIPIPSNTLLGATQSKNPATPFDAACDLSVNPPCSTAEADKARAVNLIDTCLALNTAAQIQNATPSQLAVNVQINGSTVRRPVAFVLVAPGLLDADGDNQPFDGANATASSSNPTFESPGMATSHVYDDVVMAVSHAELFSELQCGAGLSATSHSHFNAATGSFLLERAFYDYRDQLDVAVKLADADVFAAAAGTASAASGVLDGAKEILSATADTTMTFGGRAAQIGLAAAGTAAAALATGAAVKATLDSQESLDEAKTVHQDFAQRTTAMTKLSQSINRNTLIADAIGF